jgi:hypothetical protein
MAVQPFVNRIDWMEIHHITCLNKKKQGKGHMEKKWQARLQDTGFWYSIKQSCDSTTNGVAEPCLKPELTHYPEVVNGDVVLSNFIATAATKWSGYNKRLFSDHN